MNLCFKSSLAVGLCTDTLERTWQMSTQWKYHIILGGAEGDPLLESEDTGKEMVRPIVKYLTVLSCKVSIYLSTPTVSHIKVCACQVHRFWWICSDNWVVLADQLVGFQCLTERQLHTHKTGVFIEARLHKLLEGLAVRALQGGWGVFGDEEEDPHGM